MKLMWRYVHRGKNAHSIDLINAIAFFRFAKRKANPASTG